jgi:hypothetical protein
VGLLDSVVLIIVVICQKENCLLFQSVVVTELYNFFVSFSSSLVVSKSEYSESHHIQLFIFAAPRVTIQLFIDLT